MLYARSASFNENQKYLIGHSAPFRWICSKTQPLRLSHVSLSTVNSPRECGSANTSGFSTPAFGPSQWYFHCLIILQRSAVELYEASCSARGQHGWNSARSGEICSIDQKWSELGHISEVFELAYGVNRSFWTFEAPVAYEMTEKINATFKSLHFFRLNVTPVFYSNVRSCRTW